jgi:hypothetical protein
MKTKKKAARKKPKADRLSFNFGANTRRRRGSRGGGS